MQREGAVATSGRRGNILGRCEPKLGSHVVRVGGKGRGQAPSTEECTSPEWGGCTGPGSRGVPERPRSPESDLGQCHFCCSLILE